VGVRLRPGAAEAVLRIPASELTDRRVPLDFVWGRSSDKLGGRLADATSAEEAATLLEQALLARAATAAEPDPVVGELVKRLQPRRARRVTDQASDLFLSPRHLRRGCLEAIGQGPKVLHRILRFQAFLVLTEGADGDADLAGAAMTAGYADQAHLTRECSRLSGLTPRTFQAERAARCLGSHDHGPSLMHIPGLPPGRRCEPLIRPFRSRPAGPCLPSVVGISRGRDPGDSARRLLVRERCGMNRQDGLCCHR
jgi:AraC-like DNA-binding protein